MLYTCFTLIVNFRCMHEAVLHTCVCEVSLEIYLLDLVFNESPAQEWEGWGSYLTLGSRWVFSLALTRCLMLLAGILPYNHLKDMSALGHGQAARRSVCSDHHSTHTKCPDDKVAIS